MDNGRKLRRRRWWCDGKVKEVGAEVLKGCGVWNHRKSAGAGKMWRR